MNNLNFTKFVLFTSSILLFTNCGEKEPPSIWEKAANFVKKQSSESYLFNTDPTFRSLEQDHSPSKWVEYFFSPLSTRNWISEDDEYAEYSQYTNVYIKPKGIVLTPFKKKDEVNSPQLVVRADDKESVIFVEGYDFPNDKEIVFRDKWEFPKIK